MTMTLTTPQHLAPATFDTDPGFEIGWDHAHHRLVPPAEHLLQGHPVRQGWEAGQAVFGTRTLPATRHVRKWLQLRLNAWLRGKVFEGVQVTPHFLRMIDVAICPITGEPLTQGTGGPSDASVDRVNNEAGYAAGNLVVMSKRANQAKSAYGWRDCAGFAAQIDAGRLGPIDGLTAPQWARLAALASLCTPLSHAEAACMPLLVLPPNRLRVINPVQALQVVLTLRFTRPDRMPRVDQVASLFPDAVRPALHAFMVTLLARRLAAGPGADAAELRRAMEAAWASPLVLKRWQRLALRLNAPLCEQLVAQAVSRGLAVSELRCLSLAQATDGWALDSGGLVVDAGRDTQQAAALAPNTPANPIRIAARVSSTCGPTPAPAQASLAWS
jgi:hypothetical protein